MARKRGRPRSAGKMKKCPRCGRQGYPVTKTHTKTVKGKTYTWKDNWFQHYSRGKFESNPNYRMDCCFLPKKKTKA